MAEAVFKIEDAKPEDMEILRAIVRDAWLEIYPSRKFGITSHDIRSIDWRNPEGLEKRKKEIVEDGDAVRTWVTKNAKGKIVGFCKAVKFEGYGEIKGIYVVKKMQGQGLGKKLMHKAFDWFGPELPVRLKVVSYNYRAIEFYKKMGFRETGNKVSYEETKLASGKEIPRIEMMKALSL